MRRDAQWHEATPEREGMTGRWNGGTEERTKRARFKRRHRLFAERASPDQSEYTIWIHSSCRSSTGDECNALRHMSVYEQYDCQACHGSLSGVINPSKIAAKKDAIGIYVHL